MFLDLDMNRARSELDPVGVAETRRTVYTALFQANF
jgi:hypothetical protein